MVYAFDDAKAPSQHTTQYFEMFANRAIYNNGWIATPPPRLHRLGRQWSNLSTQSTGNSELHNVAEDFSQANDLAGIEFREAA